MNRNRFLPLLLLFCLLLSSCGTAQTEQSVQESKSLSESDASAPDYEIISTPYGNLANNAKNVWDLCIFDGSLYIGAGDYDINISPASAYRYDLKDECFYTCGAIPDEQIDRFCVINDKLYIPGCDPTGDWSKGNYYLLENGEFKTYRNIPYAVHCFDMVEHDGMLFAATGLTEVNESFPVSVSTDGGVSFVSAKAERKSEEHVFNRRVYKLFKHENELYALNGSDLYRYDGEKFVFESSWQNKLVGGYPFYTQIAESAYFKGKTYFTTGYLFHFADARNLQYTVFENAIVTDLAVYNNRLYVLCAKQLDNGNYLICLTVSDDGSSFKTVKAIEYGLPALSFALDDNELYLGIGDIGQSNMELKGNILKTEVLE